ncbi:MAG TPA: cytochrome c oxidase subunit 3 [Acidobacteriaceae bacterium]|jgi:cytochrome c oxidase subunit 3|nr:cytochrome c oxidase subunit 3 [Acidobacteriaceae bacterium]
MPATFTRHQVETERKDTGYGGKPPLDRRPTGGGGGDENWDSRPSGRRGPRELLMRYRLAVLSGLAGDFVFFAVLVSAFFVRQTSGHIDPADAFVSDWHPLSVPPILWINTAILLLSTITIETARRQLFHEIDIMEEWLGLGRPAVRRAAPWLIATIVLGTAFLAGQWIAWKQLAQQGMFFSSNPNSHFFYLVTGTHAVHLFLGIGALLFAFVAMFRLKKVELRQIAVDCTAWYWHAMSVFWAFLFVLLVFFQ